MAAFLAAAPFCRNGGIYTLAGRAEPSTVLLKRGRTRQRTVMQRSSASQVEWLNPPVLVKGLVQRGFGRGSKQLGTPTANLPGTLLNGVEGTERDGVYVGFASVPKYVPSPMQMVANFGRNITYGDVEERVLEAYIISDDLPDDFYGEEMRLCVIGFLRPELKFDSIEELMENIHNDVSVTKTVLELDEAQKHRSNLFFDVSSTT